MSKFTNLLSNFMNYEKNNFTFSDCVRNNWR